MYKLIATALKDHAVNIFLKSDEMISVEAITGYITNDNNEVTAIKFRCTNGSQKTILKDSIVRYDI